MKNLKELRNKYKLSQRELAIIMNISYVAYNNYETDKRQMDYTMLNTLANYFNVSIDYLLDRDISKMNPHSIITIGREGQKKTKILSEEKWNAINSLIQTMDDETDKKK